MKILLFSSDVYFIEAFSTLLAKNRHDIELECYSDEVIARDRMQQGRFPMILCEQGCLKEYIGQGVYVELGNVTIMPKEEKVGKLNIYQRADMMQEDFDHILSVAEGRNVDALGGEKRVAFFSTEGGSGKTTIAYLTAVEMAKKQKTMYWNLCPLADTENLYQTGYQHTMEEILFAQHVGSGVLELLYETMECNEDGVYVLPNIRSLGDYIGLTAEGIQGLCECIGKTGIEVVVLDIPGGYSAMTEELLMWSNKVVWVFGSTESSLRKEDAVKNDPYLKKIMSKSVFVRNKAQQKQENEISFPVSSTMQKANHISKVLEVNPEFVSGCRAIEEAVL